MRPRLVAFFLLAGCADSEVWILTENLPEARVGFAYDAPLEVDGDADRVTWSLVDGALPPGISLDVATGTLAGVPVQGGDWLFTVAAERGRGWDELDFTLHLPPVILMSGFEPFGGYDTNPSMEALWPLHEQLWEGYDLRAIELPVVWDESWALLSAEMEALNPVVVLATGMADSDAMRYETTAHNTQSGTDNADVARRGVAIVEGGPDTLPTGLPIDEMSAAVQAEGLATMLSDDAGAFLCNHVFYNLMYAFEEPPAGLLALPVAAGFVHVPPAPWLGTFSVDDITNAHEVGLGALLAWLEAGAVLRQVHAEVHTAPHYGPGLGE